MIDVVVYQEITAQFRHIRIWDIGISRNGLVNLLKMEDMPTFSRMKFNFLIMMAKLALTSLLVGKLVNFLMERVLSQMRKLVNYLTERLLGQI